MNIDPIKFPKLWQYKNKIALDFIISNGKWIEQIDNIQTVYDFYRKFHAESFPRIHVNPNKYYPGKKAYIISVIHHEYNASTSFMREFIQRFDPREMILIATEEFGASEIPGTKTIQHLLAKGYRLLHLKGNEYEKVQDCCDTLNREGVETTIYASSMACPISWLIAASRPTRIQINSHRGQPMIAPNIDIYGYFHQYGEDVYEALRKKGHAINSQYLGHGVEDIANKYPRDKTDRIKMLTCSNHLDSRLNPEYCNTMKKILDDSKNAVWYIVGMNEKCHNQKQILKNMPNVYWLGQQTDATIWYYTADIYADTSPAGSGRAVLESMRAGIPIVCGNDKGSHMNTISAALSDSGVADSEYYGRLSKLIKQKDYRISEGERMRARFLEHYELGVYIKRFNKMLADFQEGKNDN